MHTDLPIRARVLELLKKYGRDTTSFQILEPGLHHWVDPVTGDACVAYADTGGAWVVAGGPVAAREQVRAVTQRFVDAARVAGKRVRFFGLEDDISEAEQLATLHIGEQPVWNPGRWRQTLKNKRSLREQLRRARAKGVTVRLVSADEVADPEHLTRRSIDAMIAHWIDTRQMAPMSFLVYLDPYNLPEERRFLVAQHAGEVVGILIAVPIYARDGWFFEDVLRDPAAPNGTVELMFDHAMRLLADEGSPHVSYGLAPLAGSEHPWMRRICNHTRWLYDFEGLRRFKAKLQPDGWRPVYLSYPAHERGVRAVIDTLKVFAGGSFLTFGWRTLVQRASVVTTWLALLLLPWTLLLALAPTKHWFPSQQLQLAWIGFDAALFASLLALARRWRRWLANALAGLALADFTLGVIQLSIHTATRAHGVLDWCLIAAALVAPLAASVFLWSARGRGSLYADWSATVRS